MRQHSERQSREELCRGCVIRLSASGTGCILRYNDPALCSPMPSGLASEVRHSFNDGNMRMTDEMIDDTQALACRHGKPQLLSSSAARSSTQTTLGVGNPQRDSSPAAFATRVGGTMAHLGSLPPRSGALTLECGAH